MMAEANATLNNAKAPMVLMSGEKLLTRKLTLKERYPGLASYQ